MTGSTELRLVGRAVGDPAADDAAAAAAPAAEAAAPAAEAAAPAAEAAAPAAEAAAPAAEAAAPAAEAAAPAAEAAAPAAEAAAPAAEAAAPAAEAAAPAAEAAAPAAEAAAPAAEAAAPAAEAAAPAAEAAAPAAEAAAPAAEAAAPAAEAAAPAAEAAAPTAGGRVPDFFVVGHPKSGTTALYEMLRRHPQIYMPECKEPRFFADDMHLGPDRAKAGLPQSFEQYLALFAPARADQRAGEASPFYLASRTAAQEIAAVQPDARIVAILREPASFLRSLHMQFVETHVEPANDLRRALALEDARRRGRHVPQHSPFPAQVLLYSNYIQYEEQLRRLHAVFSPEQVLVLIYEDFRADNEAAVRAVLRFLEVDDDAPVAVQDANPTVRVRAQPLEEAMSAVSIGRGPLSRAAKTAIKALVPRPLRRRALVKIRRRVIWSEPQPPQESFMLELRRRFAGEVVALSEYLDRDLVTLWGYDRVL